MARKRKRPASRGSVNKVILQSLLDGNKYGYEIIKEVEKSTKGKVTLKQPSLYSSLSRFESRGYVTSYWQDSPQGGRRHYYSLTPLGRTYYKENFSTLDTHTPTPQHNIENISMKLDENSLDKIGKQNTLPATPENTTDNANNDKTNVDTIEPLLNIDNTKINSNNFDSHIQNRIQTLLKESEKLEVVKDEPATTLVINKQKGLPVNIDKPAEKLESTQSDAKSILEIPTKKAAPITLTKKTNTPEKNNTITTTNNNYENIQPLATDNSNKETHAPSNLESNTLASENNSSSKTTPTPPQVVEQTESTKENIELEKPQSDKENIELEQTQNTTTILTNNLPLMAEENETLALQQKMEETTNTKTQSLDKKDNSTINHTIENEESKTQVKPLIAIETAEYTEAEIIEQVSDSDIHVNSISILNSYRDMPLDEIKDSELDDVKALYSRNENDKVNLLPKKQKEIDPPSAIDEHKRKHSLQKLYGKQVEIFSQSPDVNKISDKAEKITALNSEITPIQDDNEHDNVDDDNKTDKKIPLFKHNQNISPFIKNYNIVPKRAKNFFVKTKNIDTDKNKPNFYIDENGILKMSTNLEKRPSMVFDNVIFRTNNYGTNISVIDNIKATQSPTKQAFRAKKRPTMYAPQMTPEERELRIKRFDERFKNLAENKINSKKAALSTLNLLEKSGVNTENQNTKSRPTSKLINTMDKAKNKPVTLKDESDPVIFSSDNLLDKETIQSTRNLSEKDKVTIPTNKIEIQNENLPLKTYINVQTDNTPDVKFVLSNKLKLVNTIINSVISISLLLIFMFILQSQNLLHSSDYTLFIIAFVLVAVLLIYVILSYLLNKNKRKPAHDFKLSHALLFGVFAFLLVAIMSYAVNAFFGLNLDNISYFLVKLIVPMILALAFVTSPLIKKSLFKSKVFY